MVGGWREHLVEHCTFQNRNPVRVFLYHCISFFVINFFYYYFFYFFTHNTTQHPKYHCISDGNRLISENYGCHFHFILHIMSDKAAFVSRALLCVQCYRGNLALYHYNSASRWQRIHLYIYCMQPKIVQVCGTMV